VKFKKLGFSAPLKSAGQSIEENFIAVFHGSEDLWLLFDVLRNVF